MRRMTLLCMALAGCSGDRHVTEREVDLNSAAQAATDDIANYTAAHRSRPPAVPRPAGER